MGNKSFEARYSGLCAHGDLIEPGDLCTYTDGEIAHVDCNATDGATNIHADGPICQSCHTIHRGECI